MLTSDGKIWTTPMEDQSLGLWLPITLKEGGGGLGFFGGWGSKQPPLHLAAGSWDRGQEGPICHLRSCQLLEAGWGGGWGDSCLAQVFSGQDGNGGI